MGVHVVHQTATDGGGYVVHQTAADMCGHVVHGPVVPGTNDNNNNNDDPTFYLPRNL